jgi:6-phosphogluconolactonase (cycloisomerase 2 family)
VEPSGKFVYITNQVSGDVSAYRMDAGTGALVQLTGSPFRAGAAPISVAVEPSGKFLYVSNYQSANVSAYSIADSGALVPVGGPFRAGRGAFAVTVTGAIH